MTKHRLNKFIPSACAVLLGLAATTYGSVPSINVTVSDTSGNVAFKGRTKADATFATGNLRAGHYVVQFDSNSGAVARNRYLLVVSSGQKKVIANAVAGEEIAGRGVAMKVAVGAGSNITGQVANAMGASNNPNVMVRNGKRYSRVTAQTGTNLGEGVGDERNIVLWNADEIRLLQDRSDEGSQVNRVGRRTKFTGL